MNTVSKTPRPSSHFKFCHSLLASLAPTSPIYTHPSHPLLAAPASMFPAGPIPVLGWGVSCRGVSCCGLKPLRPHHCIQGMNRSTVRLLPAHALDFPSVETVEGRWNNSHSFQMLSFLISRLYLCN